MCPNQTLACLANVPGRFATKVRQGLLIPAFFKPVRGGQPIPAKLKFCESGVAAHIGTARWDLPILVRIVRNLFQLYLLAMFLPMLPAVGLAQFNYIVNANNTIAITGYTGTSGVVTIPDTINSLPVTAIHFMAFNNAYGLTNIIFPNSLNTIESATFSWCTSLTSVTIPNGVTNIGNGAFYHCNLLTNVALPDSLTSIAPETFELCPVLAGISIPSNLTSIGDDAFGWCSRLTNISIPNSVTNIGNSAFVFCNSLTNVSIGNGVTGIGDTAFEGCSGLTNVTIPNSVTHIGAGTFSYCAGLTSVIVGNGITSITNDPFYNDSNVKGLYFNGNAPTLALNVFSSVPNATIYYLPGTTGWGPTFGGLPAKPWMLPYPLILNNQPASGIKTNPSGFTISWATNLAVVVEACTNLAMPDWRPVRTNTLTAGSAAFSDPQWTNYPGRFYRLRSP